MPKSLPFKFIFLVFLPLLLFLLKAPQVLAATPGKVVNMMCHNSNINGLPGGATGCITYSPGSWAVRTGDGVDAAWKGASGYTFAGQACGADNGNGWQECNGGWAIDDARWNLMRGGDGYYHTSQWVWPLSTGGTNQNDWVCKIQIDIFHGGSLVDFIVWRDAERCGSAPPPPPGGGGGGGGGGGTPYYQAVSPVGGATINGLYPTFTWNANTTGISYNNICVGTSSSDNPCPYGPSTSARSFTATQALSPNTTYYWLIYGCRPGCSGGGVGSGWTSFRTPDYGTLAVSTTPVSGGVFVNGSSWGNAPQSRSLAPGSYTVSFGPVANYNTPSSQTLSVTSSQTINVTGTYVAQNYNLTVTKPGSGTGTVTSSPSGINCGATCLASYAPGTSVTLTAAASAGSGFSGWGGTCSGTATFCNFTMDQARSVTATFDLPPGAVSGSVFNDDGTGGGVAYDGIKNGSEVDSSQGVSSLVYRRSTGETGSITLNDGQIIQISLPPGSYRLELTFNGTKTRTRWHQGIQAPVNYFNASSGVFYTAATAGDYPLIVSSGVATSVALGINYTSPSTPVLGLPGGLTTNTSPTFSVTDGGPVNSFPEGYHEWHLQLLNSSNTVIRELCWPSTNRTTASGGVFSFAWPASTLTTGTCTWSSTPLVLGNYSWRAEVRTGAATNMFSGFSASQSFSVVQSGSIQGTVFNDANGDGVQNGTEVGVNSASLVLRGGGGSSSAASLNAAGGFSLNDAAPGSYRLEIIPSSSWQVTSWSQGAVSSANSGLVSYWKLDEPGSSNLSDSVDSNTGSNQGSASTSGVAGAARSFNGSNAWISVANSANLDITGSITVSGWVKPNTSGYAGFIWSRGKDAAGEYRIGLDSGNVFFRMNSAGGGWSPGYVSSGGSIASGSWGHFAFVFDTSSHQIKIYINNVNRLTATENNNLNSNSLPFAIGREAGSSQEYFNGAIDELGIWNRALSAAEVTDLFNSGSSGRSYPFTTSGSARSYASGGSFSYTRSALAPNPDFPLDVTSGGTTTANLGIQSVPSGTLVVNLYNDTNGNGILESGEGFLSGQPYTVDCSPASGPCQSGLSLGTGTLTLSLNSGSSYAFSFNPNGSSYSNPTGGTATSGTCTGFTCSIGSLPVTGGTVNLLVSNNSLPWIQVWNGDVYSHYNGNASLPGVKVTVNALASAPYRPVFVQLTSANSGGLVVTRTGSGGSYCNGQLCSERNLLVNGYSDPGLPWPAYLSVASGGCNSSDNLCYLNSSLSITASNRGAFRSGGQYFNKVVVVNGDIDINGQTVSDLSGNPALSVFLVAKNGQISVTGNGGSNELIISGALYAQNGFVFTYSLNDNKKPLMVVKYNPNILLIQPNSLALPVYTWREVTP